MKQITVYGSGISEFKMDAMAGGGVGEYDAFCIVCNVLRHRAQQLRESGYFILDISKLDKDRLY